MAGLEQPSRIEASVLDDLLRMLDPAGPTPEGHAGAGPNTGSPPAVPPDDDGDPRRWVTLARFARFLEHVGARSDDPLTVWRCGRRFLPVAVNTHFQDLHGGLSLGEALSTALATIGHVQSSSILRLRIDDKVAVVEYRVTDPAVWPRARDAEFTLGFLEGIVRAYLGPDFRPEGVVFEHEAGAESRFGRAIGVPCIFGQSANVLALPRGHLDIRGGALPAPRGAAVRPPPAEPPEDFRTRLRRIILEELLEGHVDQARVARRCGLSPRSLRRTLARHGLGFRQEVTRVRMAEADHLIAHTSLSLGEIAGRLGYGRQAEFSRAYHRAWGTPPSARGRGAPQHGMRLS